MPRKSKNASDNKKNKKNNKPDKRKKKSSSFDDEASDINLSDEEKHSENEEEIQDDLDDDKLSDDDIGIEDEDEEEDETGNESDQGDGDDDCVYKFTKSARDRDNADDLMDDDDDEEDTDVEVITDDNRYVKPEDRISKPYLTNYERVRLLSDRAAQIASGSDPMIKNASNMDSKMIAKLELETEKTPLYIERELPGGKIEKWYLWELVNTHRELITGKNNIKINTKTVDKLPIELK